MKCPQCQSKSGFGWTAGWTKVKCSKCRAEGTMEEFGCVTHCICGEGDKVESNPYWFDLEKVADNTIQPDKLRCPEQFNHYTVTCPTCGYHAEQAHCVCGEAQVDLEEFDDAIHVHLDKAPESKASKQGTQYAQVMEHIEQGTTSVEDAKVMRALFKDWDTINAYAKQLVWERECFRHLEEELAEARYWARQMYHDTNGVSLIVPELVTWVDDQKNT